MQRRRQVGGAAGRGVGVSLFYALASWLGWGSRGEGASCGSKVGLS